MDFHYTLITIEMMQGYDRKHIHVIILLLNMFIFIFIFRLVL